MRLKFPKEEFLSKLNEFKRLYEEVSGSKITNEEILEILEGKRLLLPVTERLALLLNELAKLYQVAPWEARKWVKSPPELDKR